MKVSVLFFFAVFCFVFTLSQSKNTNQKEKKPKKDNNGWALGHYKKYFVDYGYTSGNDKPTSAELKIAIRKLKILFQFDDTITDADIVKLIESPRCGNKDIKEKVNQKSKLVRRYDLNPAWRIKSFTYAFVKYSSDLTVQQQDNTAKLAFQLWQDAVPQLDFKPAPTVDQADIKLSFERGAHAGCAQSFDGEAGPIIAHAYYPEDGRIHLDDDEMFTDGSGQGTNLYFVLVHEIGHVLGLGHSFVTGAIMNPVYKEYTGTLKLHDDDINGMRTLYAPDTAEVPTCADQDPSLCALYRAEGYCTPVYADVMIVTCPSTCDLCQ